MKLIIKESIKKIKGSIGRFLSLFFIVLLGVGFFAGIKSARGDMYLTADKYYDNQELMDIKIISTLGLTIDDVNEIKNQKNIEEVIPTYFIDTLNKKEVIRVHAINNKVNIPKLEKGRLPKKDNECVIENGKYKIGDTITLTSNDVDKNLKNTKYKIVGLVTSPMYIGLEKGITNIGNGKLSSYMYINNNNFETDVYQEIYIKVKNAKKEISYDEKYINKIEKVKKSLSKIQSVQETKRYEEILEKVNNEIQKIEKELNAERINGIKKLTKAKEELDNNKYKLDKAKKELQEKEAVYNKEKNIGLEKIESAKKEIEKAKLELQNKESEYNKTKDIIKNSIDNSKLELEEKENILNQNKDNISIEEYNEQLQILKQAKENLNKKEQEFLNTPKIIENTKKTLENKSKELQKEENNYYKSIENAKVQLENGKKELYINEKKLNEGYIEYEKSNKEFESKINEAYNKIEEQKEKLKNIPKPKWYIQDRTDNPGYIDFKNDALRVDAIAKVFPVFFLLVAALVCLNTMTRMVEEERGQIGIFKALGYGNIKIVSSYLIYVFIATLFGSILGLLIGFNVLPRIIYDAYSFTYTLPKLIIYMDKTMFIVITLVALALTMCVTLFSCYKELIEEPAFLLRPKPPKKGKKIFLEKINFIWNKISFTGKVTIRNLFRYKKRIFMTIIGIAGCSALTLTGFGLRDGITSIVKLQYEKIFNYDALFVLNNEIKDYDNDLNNLLKTNNIKDPLLVHQELFSFKVDNKKHDFYMMIPQNDDIYKFVNFKNRKTNEKYKLKDDGAIITEKMAQLLDVKIGDNIKIRDSENKLYIVNISAIVENYAYHYMYLNQNYYEKVFDKELTYNTILSNCDSNNKDKISSNLINSGKVLNTNFTVDNIKNFDTIIDSLNKIVLVILGASCLLAFIVLYNLTTINITERIREIATIKVLGFYDKEVSGYVYRETLVLTIIGIFVGLFLGVFLHAFVMKTAEMDFIMFSKDINKSSFILSALITLLFSIIVQVFTHFKLKKVDMIESLKSVE